MNKSATGADRRDAKTPGLTTDQKRHLLTTLTYKQFLKEYAGAQEQAIVQYQRNTHSLFGVGAQGTSAIDACLLGEPGFGGIDLGDLTAAPVEDPVFDLRPVTTTAGRRHARHEAVQSDAHGPDYARKVPLIYARAALKNWRAFANAKISGVTPRGNSLFWDSTSLQAGSQWGSQYGPNPADPSMPALLQFNVVPSDPGRTPQLAAYEAGRERLLGLSFDDLENALWDVLDRMVNVSGGDFDPERDVAAVHVNRWNYGYAHELTSVWDPSLYGPWADQPHVRGRRPYRNVAIANSDSGGFAYFHGAVAEAARAIDDLPA